jgi:hypothetical protein
MRLFLSQGKYVVEILKKFGMIECKSMPTPMVMDLKKMSDVDLGEIDMHLYRQLIGSLMYLVNTRPDICYAVNVLSQFMIQSIQTHWIEAKHVLRYLQGIVGYSLRYASSLDLILQGYVIIDWVESIVDQKRTYDCCLTFRFSIISWYSRKQRYVALSTTKAEYIALSVAVCEAVWLHKPLTNLFDHDMDSIIITRVV